MRVGSIAEVPEGEIRAFDLPAGRVAVVHVEARLFAFNDECTHAGCALSEGAFDDRESTGSLCACESVFDVETGEPVEGPARDPLAVHQARLVDGWVEVASQPVGWLGLAPTRPSRLGPLAGRRLPMTDAPTRFDLSQDRLPTAWLNIMPSIVQAGMQPLPPLHPGTHEPVTPDLLAPCSRRR